MSEQVSVSAWELLCQELLSLHGQKGESSNDEKLINESYRRLESIGYSVGAVLFELRAGDRLFQDPLEMIKFICKEFWPAIYQKQIDNLKTNHRGMFVIHDSAFKPLRNCATTQSNITKTVAAVAVSNGRNEDTLLLSLLSAFPAGLIRGVLNNAGYAASVSAEIIPPSTLSIRIELNITNIAFAAR